MFKHLQVDVDALELNLYNAIGSLYRVPNTFTDAIEQENSIAVSKVLREASNRVQTEGNRKAITTLDIVKTILAYNSDATNLLSAHGLNYGIVDEYISTSSKAKTAPKEEESKNQFLEKYTCGAVPEYARRPRVLQAVQRGIDRATDACRGRFGVRRMPPASVASSAVEIAEPGANESSWVLCVVTGSFSITRWPNWLTGSRLAPHRANHHGPRSWSGGARIRGRSAPPSRQ